MSSSAALAQAAARILAAYLLGSLVGSLLLARLTGRMDIRTLGSGNAGGTNALRTQGKAFAFWVVLIDVLKGYLAARWLPVLAPGGASLAATGSAGAQQSWLPAACALAVIVGHVWPLWYGFRGGKGVATLVGALAGLAPQLLAPVLAAWLIMVMAAGFVGLASMTAAAALPFAVALGHSEPRAPLTAFSCVVTLLVVYTHRGNLARMRAGSEPHANRLWLLGRYFR